MPRALPCSLLLLAGCATTGSTAFYPLDELRALDTPEQHLEVLAHAQEVAPSKRDDAWRGIVERACSAALAARVVDDDASAERALDAIDAQGERFPFLWRADAWLAQRAELGVKALPLVSRSMDRGAWPRRVLLFARADPRTKGLAQRLADEVLLKQLIPSTAAPLFSLAFERDGAAVCTSPTVTKIVLDLAAGGEAFAPALDRCWTEMREPLLTAVKSAETNTLRIRLCQALEKRAEEPAVKAACPKE